MAQLAKRNEQKILNLTSMKISKNFKQTEIGIIPSDWEVVKIGEIGEVITGTTPSTKVKEYWGEGYLFVTPTDFSNNKYVHKTERSVTERGIERARIIPKDSVMVTCIASIGEVAMSSEECITNQQINSIVCGEKANPHYVYYTMKFRKNVLKRWAGITTSPIVKKSLFEEFPLPLPSLPEQKKIAEILSTVDQAIEKVDDAIAKTERVKKGLMQELFTKGIGHKEFKDTEIGRIPKKWGVVRLSEIINVFQYGLSVKIKEEGKYPIVKMDDIVNGYVIDDNIKYTDIDDETFDNFKLNKGDILFNRTNSYELVGRTGIFLLNGNYVFASYLIRLKPTHEIVNSHFLAFYLVFKNNKIRHLATRAVHQANINATNLQKFKVPLPPLPEQKKITEILSTVDKRLELLRNKKGRLEKVKKGLMNDLLTGKRRVKV